MSAGLERIARVRVLRLLLLTNRCPRYESRTEVWLWLGSWCDDIGCVSLVGLLVNCAITVLLLLDHSRTLDLEVEKELSNRSAVKLWRLAQA